MDDPFKKQLASPAFDHWQYSDKELISFLEFFLVDLGVVDAFDVDLVPLRRFLWTVHANYHSNPCHNFTHCFCVAQMVIPNIPPIYLSIFAHISYLGAGVFSGTHQQSSSDTIGTSDIDVLRDLALDHDLVP